MFGITNKQQMKSSIGIYKKSTILKTSYFPFVRILQLFMSVKQFPGFDS